MVYYNEYAEGKDGVRYRSEDATLNSKFTLSPGDLLHILKLYHRVTTTGPRISIVFICERSEKPYLRNDWYDWNHRRNYESRWKVFRRHG